MSKVATDTATDCWEWTAYCDKTWGYGAFRMDGTVKKAHRVAYEMFVGPIPDGLTIDHLCRNKKCVNPAHLEPVDIRTNILRGNSMGGRNARKTHCPRGHEYTPENTYVWPKAKNGRSRQCRICSGKKTASTP